MKKLFCIALMMCLGLSTFSGLQAQSVSDPATLVFDIRLGRMRDGELMSSPDMAGMLNQPGMIGPDMSASDFDRIFGAVALPDNAETFEIFNAPGPPEVMPINFFVRIQFSNAASGDAMWADITGSPDMDEQVVNGTTYMASMNEMSNVLIQRVDDTTVEIATRDYVEAGTGKNLFSAGMMDAWGKVPDHAFRMAVDLQGEAQLVSQLIGMAKQDPNMDPMSSAYLDLVDNAANMRLSFDPDAPVLFELAATGVDEAQAEELRSGLDAALGIAKLGGNAALNMARNDPQSAGPAGMLLSDPNMAGVAESILGSLTAKAEGAEVMLTIPRPDGFSEAVSSLMQAIPMMMMGGMGGPPGGFEPNGFAPEDFDGGDPFGGEDPFGDMPDDGGANPFDEQPADGANPFGEEAPAGAGGDPFGGGGGEANPFGGG